jgi:hypothetical protein
MGGAPIDVAGAWSNGEFPGTFFYKQHLHTYLETSPELKLSDKSWPLSLDPSKIKYVTLEQMAELGGGPVESHWFFHDARLVLSLHESGKKEAWMLIAKAVGGKLLEKKDGLYLDVGYGELRNRARKLFDAQEGQASFEDQVLDAKYLSALYATLTDDQLRKLYAKPENVVEFGIAAGSNLEELAARRLWQRIGAPDANEGSLTAEQRTLRRAILPRLDFSKGYLAVANSNGVPSCMVRGKRPEWSLVY